MKLGDGYVQENEAWSQDPSLIPEREWGMADFPC